MLVAAGNPFGSGRGELSAIWPDDGPGPTNRLLNLALESIRAARDEDVSEISDRIRGFPRWPDTWPGEHYQLLAGLVRVLQPRVVVEVGTYLGLGSLALAKNLPAGGQFVTFDIVPHSHFPESVLRESDFGSGSFRQEVADLTRPEVFEAHRPLLESASLLFIDAAKDGRMEQILLNQLATVRFREDPIVIFDDVRLWNMLRIWHGIRRPKLDLVSFGHWSGTGWIDWNAAPLSG